MSLSISVIIPTYKPQAYLWECLDSLYRQTLSKEDFEVILILNGCCEPYKGEIEIWIGNHQGLNIQFLQTDCGGVSNARNMGLKIAKGEFIAFVDDDDYVSPSYLEELLRVSDAETVGLAYPYGFNDGEEKRQLQYGISDEFEKRALRGKQKSISTRKLFNGPCMKLIHRDIISGRRFDVRFKNGEDSLFMFLLTDKIRWVNFTSPNAIYYRRFRANSATTSYQPLTAVITDCIKRFWAYSAIYFPAITKRHPLRYIYSILGGGHIIIHRIFNKTV